jgi:citrate lyase subunit beta/citryl-CoA lyase
VKPGSGLIAFIYLLVGTKVAISKRSFDWDLEGIGMLRRSLLSVPGDKEAMIAKAQSLVVDSLFFDLEDSVAPQAKDAARAILAQSVKRDAFSSPFISVRVNARNTSYIGDDLALLSSGLGREIDSIIFPKINSLDDCNWIDGELASVEKAVGIAVGTIAVDAQIETAQGLLNVNQIAGHSRVISLSFGPLDFLADIGAPTLYINESTQVIINHALAQILIAARAHGITALDGPTVDYKNLEIFERSALVIYGMGFDGKWLIHPSQIELCHKVFTPTIEEFKSAIALLKDYEGQGVIVRNQVMVDAASIRMAQVVMSRGVAAGFTL